MSGIALYHESELPQAIWPAMPRFDFFSQIIAEQQKEHIYFVSIGGGWYEHRYPATTMRHKFGLSEDVVEYMTDHHRPNFPHPLFGVSW